MCMCIILVAQVVVAGFQLFLYFRSYTTFVVSLGSAAAAIVVIYRLWSKFYQKDIREDWGYRDGWFGRGEKTSGDDTAIYPFTINVEDDVLDDLKRRLENTRLAEPVEDSKFHYGFNPDYLKQLVKYWTDGYDWREQEKRLNKYPHFITRIEGINVHFMHIRPDVEEKKVRVIPIMIVHGWPGCFAEFYKIIPLLTTPSGGRNFAFEVICPSIPGYGFSEAPHKSGLTARAASRIFVKLMERIGHRKFYVQGGDWGSIVTTFMAKFYPENVLGLHVNMLVFKPSFIEALKFVVMHYLPKFAKGQQTLYEGMPLKVKFKKVLQEFGYYHIQSTKPDTVGCALTDSPAGMAAFLLEKFGVGTNSAYLKRDDGGLTEKFTMDELITNCMIYWVTKSYPSAARFYKENQKIGGRYDGYKVQVPSAVAVFPHEGLMFPRKLAESQFNDLVSYNKMARGGHFAAMEEPKLLAEDIWTFVETVEKRH